MKFWVVTPSYNQVEWLKLCVASVADQVTEGMAHRAGRIEVHHHVQDGGSTDGTREFLAEQLAATSKQDANGYSFSYESGSDNGMYDAINRGWKLAPDEVDVMSYLNCDEQYLPGALQKVARVFVEDGRAEVILADFIIVNKAGDYLCHKRSVKPWAWIAKFRTVGSPCTTFLRASTLRSKQLEFDTAWRIVGDAVWFHKMVHAKVRFHILHEFVTVFSDLAGNLSESNAAKDEKQRYLSRFMLGKCRGLSKAVYHLQALRRILIDCVLAKPSSISMYWNSKNRVVVDIQKPTCRWRR